MFTIQVLMKTVVIAGLIFEEQRCRFILARLMAALNEAGVRGWVANVNAGCVVPTIRDWDQMRIKRRAQSCDQIGKWIAEVAILSTSEAMTLHHNMTAEELFVLIEGTNTVAFIR